jgi:predicted enzyme related to lactoylglutathione lyase
VSPQEAVSDARLDYALTLVRVFVADFERSVRFYAETLGMPLSLRDDAAGWAQFDTGSAKLALERASEADAALVGRFLAISLAVRDIDEIHDRLVGRGVEFLAAPVLMPWGGVVAHFYDPDRNVLTLVGPPLGSLLLG